MNAGPLISIITPSLNRVKFIHYAIESVLAQQYKLFEHIIMDGGSTDGTLELLATYPHLRVVSGPDRGLYDALNKGIALAQGEIIAQLNTDDVFEPGIFAAVAGLFAQNPEADAVCGGARVFERHASGEQTIKEYEGISGDELAYRATMGVAIFNAWFFRKTIFERIGCYSLEYPLVADRDFLIRCYLGKIRVIPFPAVVYHYLQHPGSLTIQSQGSLKPPLQNDILRLAENYMHSKSPDRVIRMDCIEWHDLTSIELIITLVRHGQLIQALKVAWSAGWHHPQWPFIVIAQSPMRIRNFIRKKMPPSVSVIIPAYNRAKTIARSIHSVLAQTFQDFEVIVVDDGSTDQTCEVVEQIGDERIQLIRHSRNQGAAEARNTAMKAAAGKYIAWLDSDDEWLQGKLEIQVEAMLRAAPDQKACYTAFERIDERFGSLIYIPEYPDRKKLFLACDLGPGTTLLFERSVLEVIGYLDPSFPRYQDWDWLLRYCAKYRLLPVEQPLARVYYTWERPSRAVESSAKWFVSKYSDELRQYGAYRNVVISRRWMEVARYYAQEHNPGKTAKYVIKGLAVYPFQPLEVWAWVINGWSGVKIGRLPAQIKAFISGNRN